MNKGFDEERIIQKLMVVLEEEIYDTLTENHIFNEDEWNEFLKSNTYFKRNEQWGTPTTIVLAGNEAVDYIEGSTTDDKLEELYEEYFEIGEE